MIWFAGAAAVVALWATRWRRVVATVHQGSPIEEGREVDALGRLARNLGIRPIAMIGSTVPLEPSVVGIVEPILLWPRGIAERLTSGQVEAILAHELSHVRRRDDLAAAFHMAVEAMFWFHPLVWWLGARLREEGQRACDEEVLRLGSEPRQYAESILRTCEFCVGSRLECVTGATRSDLKKRIEAIMRHDSESLTLGKKVLLALAAVVAIAVPIAASALAAPRTWTPSPTGSAASPASEATKAWTIGASEREFAATS